MLNLNVGIEIVNNVGEIVFEDLFEVRLDFRLEVIKSVDQSSDVSSQRPAGFRLSDKSDKLIEGELFDDFAHVYSVVVIDEGG